MNKSKIIFGLIVFFLVVIGFTAANYLGFFKKDLGPGERRIIHSVQEAENVPPVEIMIEKVATNLFVPWSIVFLSDSHILFTERNGSVREIKNGELEDQPLFVFKEVSTQSEEGLMGMALDPEFALNGKIYVCLAYSNENTLFDKVVQMKYEKNSLEQEKVLIDKIPAAQFHAGCRLGFGPDKMLYITTGDATDKEIAQDKASLGGKILRISSDGSIPSDNPIKNSPIYSLGHRNPQGIDWDPVSGNLFSTEHGPSVFDGPAGGDEINFIQKGENYGWPIVSHEKSKDGLVSPLAVFTPAVAPASGMFYKGDMFPQFKNHFLVGLLKGEGILDVTLSSDRMQIASYQKIPDITFGRIREIAESPDGAIYFTTSNRDGRGKINAGDDMIYKIVPKNE